MQDSASLNTNSHILVLYADQLLLTPSIRFFFFNDTSPTEIYTLSLHDALPISSCASRPVHRRRASCCQWDSECSFPPRSYPPASVVLPRSRAPVPIPSAAGANSGSLRGRSLVPAAPRSWHPALSHRRSA